MPITGILLLGGILAVTGTPPFSLFQSEFTVLSASFQNHNLWVGCIFVGCVITIFAGFLYHIGHLSLGDPPSGISRSESDWWRLGPMLLLAGLTALLGLWLPSPLFRLIQQAAQIVRGGT
jgi:hydrogenase-4 component F